LRTLKHRTTPAGRRLLNKKGKLGGLPNGRTEPGPN